MRRILTCLFLSLSMICHAEQRLVMKEGEKAVASISAVGLNRIVVEDDRILSVKGIAGQFQMDKDEKLGQIFIQPMVTDKSDPIHLFVTTEKGLTYSLSLMTTDLTPNSIVLVPNIPIDEEKWEQNNAYETMIVQLIKAMHNHKSLKSCAIEVFNKKIKKLNGASVVHLKTYHAKPIIGESYEIMNVTNKRITLKISDFYRPGVCAVAILNKNIDPFQKTMVYIIKD